MKKLLLNVCLMSCISVHGMELAPKLFGMFGTSVNPDLFYSYAGSTRLPDACLNNNNELVVAIHSCGSTIKWCLETIKEHEKTLSTRQKPKSDANDCTLKSALNMLMSNEDHSTGIEVLLKEGDYELVKNSIDRISIELKGCPSSDVPSTDVDSITIFNLFVQHGIYANTDLFCANRKKILDALPLINIHAKGPGGLSLLHHAVMLRDYVFIALLFAHDPSMKILLMQDDDKKIPFDYTTDPSIQGFLSYLKREIAKKAVQKAKQRTEQNINALEVKTPIEIQDNELLPLKTKESLTACQTRCLVHFCPTLALECFDDEHEQVSKKYAQCTLCCLMEKYDSGCIDFSN